MECRFQQVLTVFGRFPSVPVPLCCHRLPLASLPDFNCFEQLRTVRLFTGNQQLLVFSSAFPALPMLEQTGQNRVVSSTRNLNHMILPQQLHHPGPSSAVGLPSEAPSHCSLQSDLFLVDVSLDYEDDCHCSKGFFDECLSQICTLSSANFPLPSLKNFRGYINLLSIILNQNRHLIDNQSTQTMESKEPF